MMETILAQIGANDYLQYGALGLCGLMVIHRFIEAQRQTHNLERKDEQIARNSTRLEQIVIDNTRAMNRIAEALSDRPCLKTNGRVKNPEGG